MRLTFPVSRCTFPVSLAGFVPRHRRRLMTLRARHLSGARFNALPIPARGTDGVREREDPAQPFDHARLASHDRPPLGWMIANLEEATIDRNVVTIHVEHDDVARGNADDWIPRTTTQCVRAGRTDACPTFHLQLCWSDLSRGSFHALRLPWRASTGRDWSHKRYGREMISHTPRSRKRDISHIPR